MKTTLGSIFSKKSRESGKGSISQTQALSAALAACMGTGNIVGVAAAIASGGAGAVFWMVISAIIGMMSACCENILGIKYRYRDGKGEWMGGAFVYMERGLGFKHMAKIFCVLLVIASLGIGNMTQANAAALSLSGSFGLSPAITGLILAAGVFAHNIRGFFAACGGGRSGGLRDKKSSALRGGARSFFKRSGTRQQRDNPRCGADGFTRRAGLLGHT